MIVIVFIILIVPMLAASAAWLLVRAKPTVRVLIGLATGPLPIVAVAANIAWNEYSPDDSDPVWAFVGASMIALVASAVAVGLLEWCSANFAE